MSASFDISSEMYAIPMHWRALVKACCMPITTFPCSVSRRRRSPAAHPEVISVSRGHGVLIPASPGAGNSSESIPRSCKTSPGVDHGIQPSAPATHALEDSCGHVQDFARGLRRYRAPIDGLPTDENRLTEECLLLDDSDVAAVEVDYLWQTVIERDQIRQPVHRFQLAIPVSSSAIVTRSMCSPRSYKSFIRLKIRRCFSRLKSSAVSTIAASGYRSSLSRIEPRTNRFTSSTADHVRGPASQGHLPVL